MNIRNWGDAALTVEFDNRIDPAVNGQVVSLAEAVEALSIRGVRDIVPTFRSVTIYFDPLRTDRSALLALLPRHPATAGVGPEKPVRVLRIPVCYGGEFGPDLGSIAQFAGLSEGEVVALHTGALYRVFMLGFMPGFAYMASVDARIAMGRRETPRVSVPAGSVGIAGVQTGIYPLESPGGWQIIGRTPIKVFDLQRHEPFLFKAGDTVQFYTIEQAEYENAKGFKTGNW